MTANTFALFGIIGDAILKMYYGYVYQIEKDSRNYLEATGLKNVNWAKSKFVMDNNDMFSISKTKSKQYSVIPWSRMKAENLYICHGIFVYCIYWFNILVYLFCLLA